MRWIKYGTQSDVRFTMVKRGVVDLAVTGDWTPAAADSAISKDGGNYADTTNTVAVIAGTPTRGVVGWKLTISATEAQAAELNIQIVDAATKAVEDQFLTVYTFGNASAKFAGSWDDLVRLGLTALPNAAANAAGGLPISAAGGLDLDEMNVDIEAIQTSTAGLTFTGAGKVDASVRDWVGDTIPARNVTGVPKVDVVDWLGSAPNALIAGRPDVNMQASGTGSITAASLAANTIVDAGVNLTKLNNLPEGIKKNSALAAFEFFMADSADHVTGKTGLTVAGAVSIDGAAFGALTNTPATELANGIYKINLAAADLNGDVVTLKFTSAGADATLISFKTSP